MPEPNGQYAQPAVPLRLCVLCGARAEWRYDRRGRPYHACGICQSRVFLHSAMSISGLELLQELIVRSGHTRFVQTVQQRAMRSVQRPPRKPARRTVKPVR